jgi:hypothetical protein
MSRLTFVGREQWRGRGRPRVIAAQEVIDALRQTAKEGPLAAVPLESPVQTAARKQEVAQYRRELNAAAKVLGVRVRSQIHDNQLLFYQEPMTSEAVNG